MAWQSEWFSSGRLDTFRYVRARKIAGVIRDIEEIGEIEECGGSIDYQDLTSLKVSASLPFVGSFTIGNDYLRIYSASSLKETAQKEDILHGTFLCSKPATSYTSAVATGTIDCYSLLLLVEQKKTEAALTIPSGTVAVTRARQMVEEVGLSVIADASLTMLSSDHSYDAGTSYLEIANDLLASAAFDSLDISPSGSALMSVYRDPASREPVLMLADDMPDVIFAPKVTHEFDIFDVPNRVVALYSSTGDAAGMTAVAENTDPLSLYSIANRGRVILHIEEVRDCESETALKAVADRVLAQKTSAVESVDVVHSYFPYMTGDAVGLRYTKHGLDFIGVAVSKTLELKRGMPCKTRIRRFVRM